MFYENTLKNKEKSLRHVAMVANFLDLNKTLYCKYCRKKEKIDMYDFSVSDCAQEQNGSHKLLSLFEKANGRLCQERLLRPRNLATIVT